MVKSQVKILSSKYSQKIVEHAKKSATDALKTASKRAIKKTEESTGYLIGNKIADKIGRVSKTSPQNNSETNEEEILRERYVSPDLRHKIIQHPRLKTEKYWETNINRIIYNNETSKIIYMIQQINRLNLQQEIELKQMMNHEEHIIISSLKC